MTRQQIKDEILRLLSGTRREGIERTVEYLLESTFFNARCHSHHHYAGGLAQHSLEACKWALNQSSDLPAESVIIATLLHDICTAYSERAVGIRGHGRRSVAIIETVCDMPLSKEEREAILLHMHGKAVFKMDNPLAQLVWTADKISAGGKAPLQCN